MCVQYDPVTQRRFDPDDPGDDYDDEMMEHERPSEAALAAAQTFEDEEVDDE